MNIYVHRAGYSKSICLMLGVGKLKIIEQF